MRRARSLSLSPSVSPSINKIQIRTVIALRTFTLGGVPSKGKIDLHFTRSAVWHGHGVWLGSVVHSSRFPILGHRDARQSNSQLTSVASVSYGRVQRRGRAYEIQNTSTKKINKVMATSLNFYWSLH